MQTGSKFRYDTAVAGVFRFLGDLFVIEHFFSGDLGDGDGAVVAAGLYTKDHENLRFSNEE
jgi:hypothetical protein